MTTPERIGKYQIVGKLGQGAMGEVFRGHDPVLNRFVAIKRISSGLDADEMLKKRFRREAEAVAKLTTRTSSRSTSSASRASRCSWRWSCSRASTSSTPWRSTS
jgi:serine/threonine protein kinase